MATFVPKEREILLRHPIMEELKQPLHESNNNYSYGNDLNSGLSERDRVLLSAGYRPQRVEFYTRHNPHPTRVRHMKGLLDVPICCVEDNTERRLLLSPPNGEMALTLYKNLLDSAGRNELEVRTQLALNKALEARAPPTPRTPASRGVSQQHKRSELNDDQILELLCQILQTDSVAACKAWLDQASDTEKSIVLNMLRLAASGVISYPGNSSNDKCYSNAHDQQQKGLWQQNQSHTDYRQQPHPSVQQPHPPVQQDCLHDDEDRIVQVARQLSHLASRQGHNVMDEMYYQSPWQHQRTRPRSASMDQWPITNGHTSKRRTRSHSANTVAKTTSPPPPVSVTVTKQQLQEPQQNRPPTRLRYVSTWK